MVLVLAVLAFALVFLLEKTQKEQSLPISQQKTKQTIKKLLPPVKFVAQNRLQVTPSESFALDIIPTNKLSALVYRFEILFDPKILSAKEIAIGDFFEKPRILRKEINNESGNLYFSAGITPEEMAATEEPKNKNLLATLLFEAKPLVGKQENIETVISFGKKTLIISKETKLENLSQILKPITIIITKEQGD